MTIIYKLLHLPSGQYSNKAYRFSLSDVGANWHSIESAVRYLRRVQLNFKKKDEYILKNNLTPRKFDFLGKNKTYTFTPDDFKLVEFEVTTREITKHDLEDEWLMQSWEDAASSNWKFRSMFKKLKKLGELGNYHYMVLLGNRASFTSNNRTLNYINVADWQEEVLNPMLHLKLPRRSLLSQKPVLAVKDRDTMMVLKLVLGEMFVHVIDLKTCKPVDLNSI
jgi:hypothetical protein